MSCSRGSYVRAVISVALAALLYDPSPALAVPFLGPDLASFAVLGAQGVTNVPTSIIGGNLGSAPNPSVGGGYVFTSGSLQANTLIAQNAQTQLDAAILAVNAGGGTLIGPVLTGVIGPGTYDVGATTTNIPGNLVLDGGGSNTAVWRFRFSSTLITSTTSNVSVINVGDGANVGVYWSVGTAATLNGPTFVGNVLANQLISSDGDLTIACGRLLSAESQVTLIMDKISITGCGHASGGFNQGVPEPSTLLLLGSGLAGLAGWRRHRK